MIKKKVKNVPITSLTIRLSVSDSDRCCFDVLANGFELTCKLTFGELIEFLVTVFRHQIYGASYVSDYPCITVNGSLV